MPIIMQCEPNDPGAKPAQGFPGVFVRETHTGMVVSLYERNGYDDSDFLAVIWNPETKGCETITYATTRGWTYANGARIDASPEVIEAARQWQAAQVNECRQTIGTHAARIPANGSRVIVRLSRGKNKHLDGKTGIVFWIGEGYGYNAPPRAGVEIEGQRYFLGSANLYAIENDTAAPYSWAEAITKLAAAKYWTNQRPALSYSI